ncbi:hypothetical protein SASPL_134949 [Salvia splendens]|uniref:PCI domain-containing protein n=1 Tax=Salvia splendens TaxID=180675 RepID=A0A8X8WZ62_SALSN|nr:hypothetical protein SASPL_134949 [Salvia splendens]
MDIEERQADHIDYFVKKASTLEGQALANVVVEATSHPSLFAFSEILSVPNVLELEGTENSAFLDLLRMFAHGTWSEYKSKTRSPHITNLTRGACIDRQIKSFCATGALVLMIWMSCIDSAGHLPQLVPDQVLKLKQLTVLTLVETDKVLPYDPLMQELDVSNVRELEDFVINDCMYVGIVRGKLDQLRRCFKVQFAAGRDIQPGQLGSMTDILANWLATSDNLLVSIKEKINWADTMGEMDKKHRKETEDRVEVKKTLSMKAAIDSRGHEENFSELGGVMDYDHDRSRPKR